METQTLALIVMALVLCIGLFGLLIDYRPDDGEKKKRPH